MKLWEKSKCLNSFLLVVLLKESGSKIQNLTAAYLTELRPINKINKIINKGICSCFGFGKTNTFIHLKLHEWSDVPN